MNIDRYRHSIWAILFSWQGRSNRAHFWLGSLIALVICLGTAMTSLIFLPTIDSSPVEAVVPLIGLSIALYLIVTFNICVKRLHDFGWSGWWIIIFVMAAVVLPLYTPWPILAYSAAGLTYLLVFGAIPGQSYTNIYD